MTDAPKKNSSLMPWSHRQSLAVRTVITLISGMAAACVGTIAHRLGADQNLPVGLLLAFLLLGLSTWCARARQGAIGLGLHLAASSFTVWQMAKVGPGGDILMPAGFSGDMPFFSDHASLIWLYGCIVLQVVMVLLPGRWFRIPPRTPYDDEQQDDTQQPAATGQGER